MRPGPRYRTVLLLLAVLGAEVSAARAGTVLWGDRQDRFGVSSHIGFNIEASFKNLGGSPAQTDIGLPVAATNHVYDDGFNLVDSSGNANGGTWNWGYQNASQVSGDGTVVMSSTATAASGQLSGISDAPYGGVELTYAHELGWNGSYWWGLAVGLSWMDLSFQTDRSFTTDVIRTSDTYALNGVIPPLAPYAGSFLGPGPVLGDSPTRRVQVLPGGAMTSGRYGLDANLYALRAGLLFEAPFNDWLALQFGGGGIGAWIQSDFSFSESVTLTGGGSLARSGTGRADELLGGGYAEVNLTFSLSQRLTAIAGAQYNYLGTFDQEVQGKQAEVDFKKALFVAVGLNYAF